MAGTAPSVWGGNTTGILKIKGLETVAWLSHLGAGGRPDRDNGMLRLGGCPLTGSSQARGLSFSPPPTARLAQEHSFPPILNRGLRSLLRTYCVLGLGDLGVGASSLCLPSCAALPPGAAPLPLTSLRADNLLSAYCVPGLPGLSRSAFVLFSSAPSLPQASPRLRPFRSPSLSSGPANRKQPERSRAAGPPEPSVCTHRALGRRGDFLFMRITRTPPPPPGAVPWTGLRAAPLVSLPGEAPTGPCRPQAASSDPGHCPPPALGRESGEEERGVFGMARNVGVICRMSAGSIPGSRAQPPKSGHPAPEPCPALTGEGCGSREGGGHKAPTLA